MSTSTEQRLRDLFAADAAAAPPAVGLADGAYRRVRRRRRAQAGWVTAGAAAAAVVGLLSIGTPGREVRNPPSVAASVPALYGPLKGGPPGLCGHMFTPAQLPGTGFAFDGTVTAIGDLDPGWREPVPEVAVTFQVHDWFRGGGGDTVVIGMVPPGALAIDSTITTYQVGTRLLVSGSAGAGHGPNHLRGWGGCGHTRYYDPQEALQWAAATK